LITEVTEPVVFLTIHCLQFSHRSQRPTV